MKFSTTILLILLLTYSVGFAQDNVKYFNFKKGEILDIILLTAAPDSEESYDRYKQTAFPVAFEYFYQPQPGFKNSELILGSYLPTSLIFGKWKNKFKRESFINHIVQRVPDFHEQRRKVFSYFGLTYYEISRNLSFSVNIDKFNTATSFWKGSSKKYGAFLNTWKKEVTRAGGKILLKLSDGESQAGYDYNPTTFYIVEWENQTAFRAFSSKHPLSVYGDLRNVHQFVIE